MIYAYVLVRESATHDTPKIGVLNLCMAVISDDMTYLDFELRATVRWNPDVLFTAADAEVSQAFIP